MSASYGNIDNLLIMSLDSLAIIGWGGIGSIKIPTERKNDPFL
jgi:hypothetical protein